MKLWLEQRLSSEDRSIKYSLTLAVHGNLYCCIEILSYIVSVKRLLGCRVVLVST